MFVVSFILGVLAVNLPILSNFEILNFALTTSANLELHRVLIPSAIALQVIIIISISVLLQKRKKAVFSPNNCPIYASLLDIFNLEDPYPAKLLELILHESINLIDSTCGFLSLYDSKKEQFTLEIYDDPEYQGIWQGLFEERIATVKNEVAHLNNSKNNFRLQCYLLIPVLSQNKVVALMGLGNKDRAFTQEDSTLIESFLAIAWNAVEELEKKYALNPEKSLIHTALFSSDQGIITIDSQDRIVLFNSVAEKITGWTNAEVSGMLIQPVFTIVTENQDFLLRALVSGEIECFKPGSILRTKNGTHINIVGTIAPIQDSKDSGGALIIFRDVTEEEENRKKLEFLTYFDPLTGLNNRRFLIEQLKELDQVDNLPLSIIFADIKGMRLVNDAFGHHVGDEVLQRVAIVLQRNCRPGDIVARWGGDQFVILLPQTDRAEALKVIESSQKVLACEHISFLVISVAFGLDVKSRVDQDIEVIFKNAKNNMYKSKQASPNIVSNETIFALMQVLYEKSAREERHSQRVSQLCVSLAQALGLNRQDQEQLRIAGLFHDIGKIAVDSEVLNKPGKLTSEEWRDMQEHPESSYRIMAPVPGMEEVAQAVLCHHERWDGTGYPRGLSGQEIPYMARIIAVADSYDAIISERPYRAPLTKKEALVELQRCAGSQFDPEVVQAFLALEEQLKDLP